MYGTVRAIADQRSELIARSPPLPPGYGDEPYDLLDDPGEALNLASTADHRAVEQELRAALEAHFARYAAPDHPLQPPRVAGLPGNGGHAGQGDCRPARTLVIAEPHPW